MKKIILVLFAVLVGLASCNNEEKILEKEIKDYLEIKTHKVVEVIEYSKIEDLPEFIDCPNPKDFYLVDVKYRINDNIFYATIILNEKDKTVNDYFTYELNEYRETANSILVVDSLGNYVDDDGNVIQIVDSI